MLNLHPPGNPPLPKALGVDLLLGIAQSNRMMRMRLGVLLRQK